MTRPDSPDAGKALADIVSQSLRDMNKERNRRERLRKKIHEPNGFLSLTAFANQYKLSESRLRYLASIDKIPYIKINRTMYFDPEVAIKAYKIHKGYKTHD